MFKRWFNTLNQGLEAMVARYAIAKTIKHEMPQFRSHDERIIFLAKEAISGYFFKDLSEKIRNDGYGKINSTLAVVEFAWLMFSLKDWEKLSAVIRDKAPHHDFPGYMADLYFLSIYRLNWEPIARGLDHTGFSKTAFEAIEFIRKYWKKESDRLALFSALLQNSLGNRQEARDSIIRFSKMLELIPPLAGAKATLPKPASPNAISWPLDIVRSTRKRATLVSIDRIYYERYAAPFLAIHSVTNPDRCIHFHCIGFDPRDLNETVEIDDTIGFTIDHTDLSDLSARDKRGYYACARLMHAIAYLDIYDDILISDIDGSIELSASDVLTELGSADVIIKSKIMQPDRTLFNLPWATIPAGANIVCKSAGGVLFAQYLRDYLSEIFKAACKKERPMWFADQCALFYGYLDLRDQVEFRNCDRILYNQGRDWSPFSSEAVKGQYIEKALRDHALTMPTASSEL